MIGIPKQFYNPIINDIAVDLAKKYNSNQDKDSYLIAFIYDTYKKDCVTLQYTKYPNHFTRIEKTFEVKDISTEREECLKRYIKDMIEELIMIGINLEDKVFS